jgi:hypothetical protein
VGRYWLTHLLVMALAGFFSFLALFLQMGPFALDDLFALLEPTIPRGRAYVLSLAYSRPTASSARGDSPQNAMRCYPLEEAR